MPRANARVGESIRRNLDPKRDRLGSHYELASAANVDRDGIRVRWAAQLVRSALLPDASAGAFWPLPKFLHRCVCGYRAADARVCFAARALLRECLVERELAQRDWRLEHSDGSVDQRAGVDACEAKVESRLVLGSANRVYVVRNQLAVA